MPIPPLLTAGNYVVDNLRLEQCTDRDACATSTFVMALVDGEDRAVE